MNATVDNSGNLADTENFAAPPRGPIDAVRTCLVKFFDFRGRASRSEFWWFFAVVMTLALLEALLPESLATAGFLLTAVVVHPPLWAVTVRRLHDINRTGWWIFPYAQCAVLNTVIGFYLLYVNGFAYYKGDEPIRWVLELFVPVGAYSPMAFAVLSAYVLFVLAGLAVLACFCLLNGKPQRNRFD